MAPESSSSAPEPLSEIGEAMKLIDAEIDKVQQPIINQLNAWLASMEGEIFSVDAVEQHSNDIELIRNLVRRAGCELIYDQIVVQLRFVNQARAKNLKIELRKKGPDAQRVVYSKIDFPKLEVHTVKVFEKELS